MADGYVSRVDFDDGEPSVVHFALPIAQAAVIGRLLAGIAPKAMTDATGDVIWGNALYDAADTFWSFACRFYDDAWNDVIPPVAVSLSPTTPSDASTP